MNNKQPRKTRFFYHYYKKYDMMSIHFKGKCYRVNEVKCEVPCETKRNKSQPRLVMRGFANELIIENGVGIIK